MSAGSRFKWICSAPAFLCCFTRLLKKINHGKEYLVGLQPLGFKVFVDGVILNSVGVWERFKDKIYPRIRVPDFILPLKLALFSPFLGVSVFLMG